MPRPTLAVAAAALCVAVSPAFAQVSDEEVTDAIVAYQTGMQEIFEAGTPPTAEIFESLAKRATEGFELDELTPEQMLMLHTGSRLLLQVFDGDDVLARVRATMEEQTEEGAHAALLHAIVMMEQRSMVEGAGPFIGKALRVYFEHPEAMSTMGKGYVSELLRQIEFGREYSTSIPAGAKAASDSMIAFTRKAIEGGDTGTLAASPYLVEALAHAEVPEETRDKLEVAAKERINTLLASQETADDRDSLEQALFRFEREDRIANLVGGAAPGVEIIWSSNDAIGSLADLEGKVVVLDFWATWCGPCVSSFPQVRDLQERYDGLDVAIVGVTSVQGTHYNTDRTTVDCTDDPDKEFGLMAQYMADNDITWDVVFTEQTVFNPEYVVEGIPHVVIIDPEGTIRHRGLHPMDTTKKDKIDAILKEFGKATPS